MTSGDMKSLESAGIMDTFLSYLQSNSKVDPISSYRAKLSQLLQSTSVLDAEDILAKVKSIPILRYEVALLQARVSDLLFLALCMLAMKAHVVVLRELTYSFSYF